MMSMVTLVRKPRVPYEKGTEQYNSGRSVDEQVTYKI